MPRNHRALGKAIDPGSWDAEAPLGRIVLIAHAAFLEAGFVSCGKPAAGLRRLPRQVGLSASTLSLRYSIPELVHPRNGAVADAAVLRLCAHGKFLILYGYLTGDGNRPSTRWACLDALSVAPVLSGDLDATAQALANDALGVQLWKGIADGICRRLFLDICHRNRHLLPMRFLLLPADLQSAILSRLSAVDLAMVECTCTGLRDIVAGHELWRAKYMVKRRFGFLLLRSELSQVDVDGWSGSWKEMYLRARRSDPWRFMDDLVLGDWAWLRLPSLRFMDDDDLSWLGIFRNDFSRIRRRAAFLCFRNNKFRVWHDLDRCKRQDPTKHLIRRCREKRSHAQAGDGDSLQWAMALHGSGKRRYNYRDGAIHSPSARYRWTHR